MVTLRFEKAGIRVLANLLYTQELDAHLGALCSLQISKYLLLNSL